MSHTNEPTHREHYVPRMYLRRFCEPPKKKGKQAQQIWAYDIQKKCYCSMAIDSVCFETDLYEIKDASGNIVHQNQIENRLAQFEYRFSTVLTAIVKRTKYDKNLLTHCFLNKEEKAMLIWWLYLQIARTPSTITVAKNLAEELLPDLGESTDASNIAVWSCLEPLIKGRIDMEKPGLFQKMAHWFTDMAFVIGRCSQPQLFTCDNPIYLFHPNKDAVDFNTERPERIIFPLDPTAVLIMIPNNKENTGNRNIMINLTDELLKEVQWCMARSAKRWIFSRQRFSNTQITLIKSAREDING